jgi:hypothetical protein
MVTLNVKNIERLKKIFNSILGVDIEQRSIHTSNNCLAEDSSGSCINGKCAPGFVCDSSQNKCCPSLGTSLGPCIGDACPDGKKSLIFSIFSNVSNFFYIFRLF